MSLRNVLMVVTAVFDAVLFYLFNRSILGNPRARYFKYIYFAVVIFEISIMQFISVDSALRIFLFGTVNYVLLLCVFNGSAVVKLFLAALLTVIIQIGDIFTWGFVLMIFPDYISGSATNPNLVFITGTIISYLYITLIVVIFNLFPKRYYGNLSKTQGLLLTVMPLFSYVIIAVLLQYLKTQQSNNYYMYLLPSAFFVALLFFIVMFFRNMHQSQENARVSVVLNNQIEQFNKHYEAMQASHQLLRERSHDWKNHLLAMKGIAESGDLDELCAYIDSAYSGIESNAALFTGNPAIDIILRVLNTKCESAKIVNNINIKLPIPININTADFCVLISNAVDNAFEACERITQSKRQIDVDIVTDDKYLYFTISNTIQDLPTKRNGQFVTSKTDTELHGIGLQSIYRIADKYSGHISVSAEGGTFTLRCALKNGIITD